MKANVMLPNTACTPAAKRAGRRGGLRVFRQFAWLEAGYAKVALSCPAQQWIPFTALPSVGMAHADASYWAVG